MSPPSAKTVKTAGNAVRWLYHEFGLASIHSTGRNAYLIILARTCRMFAYGTSSLILAIFFSALGISDKQIGLFMTLTLVGDVFLGTTLSLVADRVGRRRVMLGGSLLMVMSGVIFALFENFWLLLFGAIVGVISTTGGDFGPFRSIEESMLSQLTTPLMRSDVLAWHVSLPLIGSSLGSEAAGRILHWLHIEKGWSEAESYHSIFWIYAVMGLANLVLVLLLTQACELQQQQAGTGGYTQIPQDASEARRTTTTTTQENGNVERSAKRINRVFAWLFKSLAKISGSTRSTMYKLWVLLAIDSLADGMVPYSLTNYYLDITFHPSKSTLGDVTSVSYFLGGLGATLAGPLARRIGLINTMVFTHIPSSAAVLVFPFPPYFWMSAALLMVRAALNSMDQAPRTSLIAAVVKPEERTAVMGVTSTIRTIAAMIGPSVTGLLASGEHFWVAFVAAGVCRLVYDFGLYGLFVNIRLHQHEATTTTTAQHMEEVRGNRGAGRRSFDRDDEEMELESIFDSDVDSLNSGKGKGDGDAKVVTGSKMGGGLKLPSGLEHHGQRARSRSPHRVVDG